MEEIFLKLLHMSTAAGWLTAAVIVLRLVLKKAPKRMRCILWALVGLRLLCPFSFESALSLIPRADIISQTTASQILPDTLHITAPVSGQKTPEFSQMPAPASVSSTDIMHLLLPAAAALWLTGTALLLLYGLASSLLLYRRLQEGIQLQENIWICDHIDTPFIFGIIHPRIYLPSDIGRQCAVYAIAHEKAHLARLDHLWKPLGYVLLAVYWFHPAIWAAYILFCKDIELACDEKVIQNFDSYNKKEYSAALLDLSISCRRMAVGPLAFGEGNVKERVKEVLNYKRPALWMMLTAAICCMALAVCFLTDPVSGQASAEENADNNLIAAANTDPYNDELTAFTEKWAKAFVNRNGKMIAEMLSEQLYAEWGFQPDSDNYSFGFSSPWPWDDEHDFVIQNITEDSAEILYYAHTSDPHITVWKERLSFGMENGSRKVVKSGLNSFDAIDSKKDFMEAYPSIQNTMMDYLKNGLGDALETNAMEYSEYLYETLCKPETAAVFLLNLSEDTQKVTVNLKSMDENGTHAVVEALFAEGNEKTDISMHAQKPGGIWIPQDAE